MMPFRSLDVVHGFIGEPKQGKTDAAVRTLLDQWLGRAFIFVHDVQGSIPRKLHDGREVPLKRYDAIPADIAADHLMVCNVPADRLLEHSWTVGRACLEAGGKDEHGEYVQGWPVIIYIDEVVMAKVARVDGLSDAMEVAISQRRHKHVGVLWSTQAPGMVHYSLLGFSNELRLFMCTGEHPRNRMRQASIPADIATMVEQLPPHTSIHFVKGSKGPIELWLPDGTVMTREESNSDEKEPEPAPIEPPPTEPPATVTPETVDITEAT